MGSVRVGKPLGVPSFAGLRVGWGFGAGWGFALRKGI
jgi:hypothetical protein